MREMLRSISVSSVTQVEAPAAAQLFEGATPIFAAAFNRFTSHRFHSCYIVEHIEPTVIPGCFNYTALKWHIVCMKPFDHCVRLSPMC